MTYDYKNANVMEALFSNKLDLSDISSKYKMVELGHGVGIGHIDGSYSQYIKALSEHAGKGNGIVYIGKSIEIDKDVLSDKSEKHKNNKNKLFIQDPTDKFSPGDIPKILIMFYNILNQTNIKVLWKDSNNDIILEQYYEIPSAHSLNYDWWDQYTLYFIGPENLEEGNYKIDITSTTLGVEDKIITLTTSLEFFVEDLSED